MTAGSQTQQVQTVHVAQLHSGQVAERQGDRLLVVGVHHHRTYTRRVATVAQLSLTAADLLVLSHLLHILVASSLLQERNSLLRLLHIAHLIGNHEGNLAHLVDVVTTGHHQSGNRRSSQSRHHGVSLLVGIDSAVPLSPDLGGGEHATLATHVSERSLTRSRGTSSRHTRDTSHGSSGSPGNGRVLVTSALEHSVRLTSVLSHATLILSFSLLLRVDELDDIRTDRSSEHSRKRNGGVHGISVLNRVDRNNRASSLRSLETHSHSFLPFCSVLEVLW